MNMYLRVNAYVCVCLCTCSEHFSWQWNGNFQQVNGECCRNGRCSMAMFEYCWYCRGHHETLTPYDIPKMSLLYPNYVPIKWWWSLYSLMFHSKNTILCWQCILLIEPPHHTASLPKAQNNSQLPLRARAKRKEGEMKQQKHCVHAMKNCERMCWNNNTISGLIVYFTTQNMHVISNNKII